MHISHHLFGSRTRVVRWAVAGAAGLLATLASPALGQVPSDPTVPGPDAPVAPAPPLDGRVTASQAASGESLDGTFLLDPGDCDGSGTHFRMAQPGGSPDEGPYVDNNDSACDDGTITPLEPGSDGGLITGAYQPHPDPAFEGNHAVADRITMPQSFFGTDFAVATNSTDPQTGTDVPPPDIRVDASGTLSGDLRSFGAAWQTQHFNQGSPKPDGSTRGGTTPVTGTLDESTGRFVLEWSSQIEGGPFNNFTGVWHLEGEFRPDDAGQAPSSDESAAPGTSPETAPTSPQDDAATTEPVAGTAAPSAAATAGSGSLAQTGGTGLPIGAIALVAVAIGAIALLHRSGS